MGRLAQQPAGIGWMAPYLFLGGVAAGSYTLAALASLFGREADRRKTRGSYRLSLVLVVTCAAVRVEGNWPRSPDGMTGLGVFGLFCFVSFLGLVSAENGSARGPGRSWAWAAFETLGTVAAVAFVTSCARLLSRGWVGPFWTSALLLASAATTGVAAVVVVSRHPSPREADRLGALNGLLNVLELAVLTAFSLSIRPPNGLALMRMPGMLIPLFVVPVGLVLPLILGETRGRRGDVDAALLTLFGGFLLCVALTGMARPTPTL